MNDSPPIIPGATYPLAGEWWWHVGVFAAAVALFDPKPDQVEVKDLPNGCAYTIADRGTITITGDETKTTVCIDTDDAHSAYWGELLGHLGAVAANAQMQRRRTWASSADGVIEHYYRAKARNPKLTLKDVAELTGYNYTYLSQIKSAYDKAGKWGSSPKTTPKH